MSIVLGLGSNLGDRNGYLEKAKKLLQEARVFITKESEIIETEPYGVIDQPRFLNQVVIVDTMLQPFDLLSVCNQVEAKLKRKRESRWGARTIDIDILFYHAEIVENETLTIPHKEIAKREFVLTSLNEIMPTFTHPSLGLTIKELWENIQ